MIKISASQKFFLRKLFNVIDKNGDGSLTPIEFILALRDNEEVAEQFHLARKVHEGITRDKFEQVFQSMDKDGHRKIVWNECFSYFAKQHRSAAVENNGSSVEDRARNLLQQKIIYGYLNNE